MRPKCLGFIPASDCWRRSPCKKSSRLNSSAAAWPSSSLPSCVVDLRLIFDSSRLSSLYSLMAAAVTEWVPGSGDGRNIVIYIPSTSTALALGSPKVFAFPAFSPVIVLLDSANEWSSFSVGMSIAKQVERKRSDTQSHTHTFFYIIFVTYRGSRRKPCSGIHFFSRILLLPICAANMLLCLAETNNGF